jgi:ABC-type transport system involved in Fe-S cluster assembly, ATPase component
MLKLEKISWTLPDGTEILTDITLTIPAGKLTVVTGPNGGGKTTLAKIIAGIEKPTSGRILFNGEDITNTDITTRAKIGIAYAFQQPVRFKGLTVRDMLELASAEGTTLGDGAMCALLEKVGLCADEYMGREMNASLSGGEIKRIEIATVLARKSRLAVFDEPEAGIDLWSFSRLVETFENLRKSGGGTLMVISHQERILSIADEIIVVADGKLRLSGSGADVLPQLLGNEKKSRCPLGKDV